jgi:hypothetical protein
MGQIPIFKSGPIASLLPKTALFSTVESYALKGSFSARSVVANTANALAGRISQTATSYAIGSAQRQLLSQLSEAVAGLAAQIGVLSATAPSQKQSSK